MRSSRSTALGRTTACLRAGLIAGLAAATTTLADGVPEPSVVIYGSVLVDGSPPTSDVVLQARNEEIVLVQYTLGDNPAAGDLYVLEVPLVVSLPGELVPSDAVQTGGDVALYANGADTGVRVPIDGRAAIVRINLDIGTTTTTTLPGSSTCGDPSPPFDLSLEPALITATDALFALNAAVGLQACAPCVCDVNDDGNITAGDALRILNAAVGQAVALTCPDCGA